MKCYHCNCPAAILDFNLISCFNCECRHFDKDILDKSDWAWWDDKVNGDSIDDLRWFLLTILENEFIL